MRVALVDTSVLIHLFPKHLAALAWFNAQTERLSVTAINALEFLDGVPNKPGHALCLAILGQFELIHHTTKDQNWAIQQISLHRLSNGVHPDDCLTASVCHRLQIPIYTNNEKDLLKLLPVGLLLTIGAS